MVNKSVLVVAAHPDDEVLGCGGTIAWHVANGDRVFVLFLADGEGARGSLENVSKRRNNCLQALECLGVIEKQVIFGEFPDNQMDSVNFLDVVRFVEKIAKLTKPNIVYTHHHGDLNIDHVLSHKAVLTAFRPLPDRVTTDIYGFEVLSSTAWSAPSAENFFSPHRFVNVSGFWLNKIAAMKKYDSEVRPFPHARSYKAIEALAVWRGGLVGLEKAEAFTIIRQIIR